MIETPTPVLEPVLWFGRPPQHEVAIRFQPIQVEALYKTPLALPDDAPYARHQGYGGAAGGGKSFWARSLAAMVALQWPGSTGIIFRENFPELKENHIDPFLTDWAPWEGRLWRYVDRDKTVYWRNGPHAGGWRGGSRTLFGYLELEKHLRRYLGNQYDFMAFEEATQYPERWVKWLTGHRLRATVRGVRPFAVYPSNPGDIGHAWYKRLFIDRDFDPEEKEYGRDYTFTQARVFDNAVLLDRDPEYVERLDSLPEPYRSWYYLGDFSAGLGLALADLRRDLHTCAPFAVPAHWTLFGSFDWGYAHPWVFMLWAVNEDGRLFLVETVRGRLHTIDEIAERVRESIPVERLRYIDGSRDLWNKRGRELGETNPTFAEQLIEGYGWRLRRANVERIKGLNNIRRHLQVHKVLKHPLLVVMQTEENMRAFRKLEGHPSDPDNPEDALKMDADEMGKGGDDEYDCFRYGVNSRTWVASDNWDEEHPVDAWSKEALAYEAEQQRRGTLRKSDKPRVTKGGRPVPRHPEFGYQA